MSHSTELIAYIARLRQRLQLDAWLRGAAVFCATAVSVTVALVLVLNRLAFPLHAAAAARIVILAALACAAAFGLALPLARLTPAFAVRRAESRNPALEQRLTTFEERIPFEERAGKRAAGSAAAPADPFPDPFLELLAADTLAHTRSLEPGTLVPRNRLFALGGAGFASLSVLVWMIAAGPGYLGYGASLLWTGARKNTAPLYSIVVAPGNTTVRRNSDALITARVLGMDPGRAQIFARFESAAAWEPVAMQPAPDAGTGATYQFVFAGLPASVEYYVAAGPLVSPHYKVRVVDLPSVKEIRVTYRYPAWTGMKPVTEEHSGDLRAIEGTDAAVEIEMDRPLHSGQLLLDDGQSIPLAARAGNLYRGSIHMSKDGAYHVAAIDEGQPVRVSEDYFIATDKATPPEIAINRPTGDYRASPIEEVTVGVKAADEFGLKDLHLHYSVNGGPDRDVSLLQTPGAKSAAGSFTLALEDFKLVPGDLVSLYATARDGNTEARTDISFIQVDPFEREFSQSQQSGGGAGAGGNGGDNQIEISRREKELIAATWKQQNDKTAAAKDAAAQGEFLSDAQQKLRDQVNALSVRIESRDISDANQEFTDFDKDMQSAAAAMGPSADKLKATQWKDAIPLEQKALQALLRAEATFRQIQVAFGQRGGGGGSGGGNAGRDLASLFDLELDTEKNQYETAQTASPAEQHEKDIEDALEKLDALARREQDLANQQQNPQQSFEQRWQQEMLRREAEQLQRQMEQMAQNGQQGVNGSPSGASDAQADSGSKSAAQGRDNAQPSRPQNSRDASGSQSASSSDQRIEQALSRLQQATGAMRRDGEDAAQNADSARQAADRLRDAANLLGGSQQQLASGKLDALAQEAARLADEEHAQAQRIDKLAARQDAPTRPDGSPDLDSVMQRFRQRDQLAAERQQLSNDLSSLQKNLRDAARAMAPHQPGAAQKLRDALTEMDDSDLDNRVQRTADWLRSGINPNSNGTEDQIAQGLGKLSRQLAQAQQQAAQENPQPDGASAQGDESAALDQVERLRGEVESMSRQSQPRASMPGAQSSAHPGQNQGGSPGGNGQPGPLAGPLSRNSQGGAQPGSGFDPSGQNRNAQNGVQSGDTRARGGAADGTVWGNYDTGNNTPRLRGQPGPAPAEASGNPADTERTYRESLRQLNQLRQMAPGDPQFAKDVADLARQMQHLDPSRFPGNPEMVEQMHREVLNSVNRLELELEREGIASDARTGKPYAVPPGYQDSVAEYYKRLSKNP
jgi:hypothetical protein